jgi:hypothetical protein
MKNYIVIYNYHIEPCVESFETLEEAIKLYDSLIHYSDKIITKKLNVKTTVKE